MEIGKIEKLKKKEFIPNLFKNSINLDLEIYKKLSGLLLLKLVDINKIDDKNYKKQYFNKKMEKELKKDYNDYLSYEKEEFENLILKYEKVFHLFQVVNMERKIFRNIVEKMLKKKFWKVENSDNLLYDKIKGVNIEVLQKRINILDNSILKLKNEKEILKKENLELHKNLKKNEGYLKKLLNVDSPSIIEKNKKRFNLIRKEKKKKLSESIISVNDYNDLKFQESFDSNSNNPIKKKKFFSSLNKFIEEDPVEKKKEKIDDEKIKNKKKRRIKNSRTSMNTSINKSMNSSIIRTRLISHKKSTNSTKNILTKTFRINKNENVESTKDKKKNGSIKSIYRRNTSSSTQLITSKITSEKIVHSFKMRNKIKNRAPKSSLKFQDYDFLSNLNIKSIRKEN